MRFGRTERLGGHMVSPSERNHFNTVCSNVPLFYYRTIFLQLLFFVLALSSQTPSRLLQIAVHTDPGCALPVRCEVVVSTVAICVLCMMDCSEVNDTMQETVITC